MGNLEVIGRWLVILGGIVILVGGILWLLGKVFGLTSLPGTLKFEFSGVTCIFPILTMIVLSVLLTIVLNVIARFLNK